MFLVASPCSRHHGAFSHTTHGGYNPAHQKLQPPKCCENCLPSATNLKLSHHLHHIFITISMSDENISHFGNSLSISRESSSSNSSSKLEDPRIHEGISLRLQQYFTKRMICGISNGERHDHSCRLEFFLLWDKRKLKGL